MQPLIAPPTYLFLFSCAVSILLSIVLGWYALKKNEHNRWLALYYFLAGYGFFTVFLGFSGLMGVAPWYHLYRTGNIAALLIMPVSFLYMRSLLEQVKFRAIDLIHLLPALLFIVDFIPFYMKPALYKMQQAQYESDHLDTAWQTFSQSSLGIGYIYVPLRITSFFLYWLWQIYMIWQASKIAGGKTLVKENKEVMLWVRILCISQTSFFIAYFLVFILHGEGIYVYTHTSAAIGVALTIIVLLMQPQILYGLKGTIFVWENDGSSEIIHKSDTSVAMPIESFDRDDEAVYVLKRTASIDELGDFDQIIKTKQINYLSHEKLEEINRLMMQHLSLKQSYLNKGYTTRHLSTEMNIQPYLLSSVINQIHQTNFNDYLNSYRIIHAKTLLEKGEGKLLTLEALAEQCGFNNRNSFTLAFKKHTGVTPSVYNKSVLN